MCPFDLQTGRAEHVRHLDRPDPTDQRLRVRPGTGDDLPRLVAMHARCSDDTVHRRYHSAMPRLAPRLAHGLLQPEQGWSVVAARGPDLLGIAVYAADRDGTYDVGLLVEDRWQRQGVGTRLRGIPALTCTTQSDNSSVPRTIRRAGFDPHISVVDGLTRATFSVKGPTPNPGERVNRLPLGDTTRALVTLLHDREELRHIYPVANMIDQAARAGA